MKTKLIDAAWLTFRDLVVPEDADELQIEVTHEAFIAGAGMMFNIITTPVTVDGEPIGNLDKMEMIDEELEGIRVELELAGATEESNEEKFHH